MTAESPGVATPGLRLRTASRGCLPQVDPAGPVADRDGRAVPTPGDPHELAPPRPQGRGQLAPGVRGPGPQQFLGRVRPFPSTADRVHGPAARREQYLKDVPVGHGLRPEFPARLRVENVDVVSFQAD